MFATDRRLTWVARIACAGVVGACVWYWLRAVWGRGPTDFDDAYMFLRYAHNLSAGHGFAWNAGEAPVYGATSLPYVVLLAGLRAVLPGVNDGRLLQVASMAAAALAVALLVLACARFSRQRWLARNGWLWGAVLVPALVLTDSFVFHASTGMDTMLSLAANAGLCLATLWLVERRSPGAAALAGVAAYVAFAVRPDNLLDALLLPALAILLLCPAPRRPLLVPLWSVLLLLLAGDLGAKRLDFGSVLPLSFQAKRPGAYTGFGGEHTWNTFLFLRVFLGAVLPFLLVLVVLFRRRALSLYAVWLVPVALTTAALFFVNPIMGHLGRFFFPSLAFVVVAAAQVADRWLLDGTAWPMRPGIGWLRPMATRLLVVGALLLAGSAALEAAAARHEAPARTQTLAPLARHQVPAAAPLPELDSWRAAEEMAALARAVPAGTRFAMSEHGLPGARAPDAVIIDVLGLHDPAFSRRFAVAELWRRGPDFIWMPHPDHTGMLRALSDSGELWARYRVYPDAFSYGLAVRAEGPGAAELRRVLEQHWATAYPGFRIEDYRARRVRRDGPSDTLAP